MSRRRHRPKSRPRMTVRHASDLLAVIPYLVGFHPSESIVAVLMRSGKVALTMRVDLPRRRRSLRPEPRSPGS